MAGQSKDPKKLARQVFCKEYGAGSQSKARGIEFTFADGAVVFVSHQDSFARVTELIRGVRSRYGAVRREDRYGSMGSRSGKPVIDFERLVASAHAKERLSLMQRQARVEFREVLHCLRLPERVLWSDTHGSWLWVRDRLAVAVAETRDGFVITTVLWSTTDLWEAHPRPA